MKIIGMRSSIFFVLLMLLVGNCSEKKNIPSSLLEYIPESASLILKINDFVAFKSELRNNNFLETLEKTIMYDSIVQHAEVLEYLEVNSESLLSFSQMKRNDFEFVFVTTFHPDLFQLEDIIEKSIETITFENERLTKYKVNDITFFSFLMNDKIVVASSRPALEELIQSNRRLNEHEIVQTLYKTANSDKPVNVFVNLNRDNPMLSSLLIKNSQKPISKFSDWMSFDLNMGQDFIHLNGISVTHDSIGDLVDLLKNTKPLASITPSLAPSSSDAILSFMFDNHTQFENNRIEYLGTSVSNDSVFNTVEEVGSIFLGEKEVVALNTYGSENIATYLDDLKTATYSYQGNEVSQLSKNDFINDAFDPIIKEFDANYFVVLENAFLFSEDKTLLETIIRNVNSGTTFDQSPVFKSAQEVLAKESSILFISNSKGMQGLLSKNMSNDLLKGLKKSDFSEYVFSAQIVAEDNFYHSNLIVQKTKKKPENNTTSQLFSVQLDGKLATDPQFVLNHRTKKKEIVVQDENNDLYLISTEGKVLWKKHLQGRIQGKIHQVDIYKNDRLQLAFTTDNQFLILDRNGKEVQPFTMSYSGGNLNPLAVFDYDRKKEYRFVVTQRNKVFMYNSKGNIVKGFTYTDAKRPILSAPQHFRIGKKDYLVFKLESGELKILSRTGKNRISVSKNIDFSNNAVYAYKNQFVTTNKKGTLIAINEKGKISETKLNLNQDHGIDATSKTLAVMNDNVLTIRGKSVELELGVYTKPKVFYLYDTIYVSVTDLQNQKIYLFNSQAAPIPNFPVFGTSLIDLDDLDNDKKLELVTKDRDNSLIIYKMN